MSVGPYIFQLRNPNNRCNFLYHISWQLWLSSSVRIRYRFHGYLFQLYQFKISKTSYLSACIWNSLLRKAWPFLLHLTTFLACLFLNQEHSDPWNTWRQWSASSPCTFPSSIKRCCLVRWIQSHHLQSTTFFLCRFESGKLCLAFFEKSWILKVRDRKPGWNCWNEATYGSQWRSKCVKGYLRPSRYSSYICIRT